MNFESPEAFLTMLTLDLVLADDNLVVIGLAAAGLAGAQRGKLLLRQTAKIATAW